MQKEGCIIYAPLKNINRKDFYVLEWLKESTYLICKSDVFAAIKHAAKK